MIPSSFICANWGPEQTICKKEGIYTCKNCHLVIYCGQECQKSHWPHHKLECKSTLGKKTWQPAWVIENRTPAFYGDDPGQPFGTAKFLWGNVPAFDVLKLKSNEGETYARDLRLLFAASGDLRNVVKTVAHLPASYEHTLKVTINDEDFDVVARNVIILLIALVAPTPEEAVDCIIHIWYSTLVRESDIDILHNCIRPLIHDACKRVERFEDQPPGTILGNEWTFGPRSLTVFLERPAWNHLLSLFNKPAGLTAEQAQEVRAATTLAHSSRDFRDEHMTCLSPSQRIAFIKFRQDGLLLPFGFPRHEFNEPNPTFFQAADTWPMIDTADPLHGWP